MENSKNDKLMRFGLFIPLMPMILTVILIIVRGVPWPMLRMSLVSVGVSLGWRRVKFPPRKLGAVQWLSSKKEWNFWDNLNTYTVTWCVTYDRTTYVLADSDRWTLDLPSTSGSKRLGLRSVWGGWGLLAAEWPRWCWASGWGCCWWWWTRGPCSIGMLRTWPPPSSKCCK